MGVPAPQAIFFDAGGTLVRPARPVGAVYAEVATHYGAILDAIRVQREFKNAFKTLQDRSGFPVPRDGQDRDWWREVVRQSLIKEEMAENFPFEDFFAEVYETFGRYDVWRVFPEVEGVLAQLRERGIPLYVLSNWDARLRETLRGLGLLNYFEAVLISSELGVAKPELGIYAQAAGQANVAPEAVLMVGDDEENDYWAPRRAGWSALIIDRGEGEDLTKVL